MEPFGAFTNILPKPVISKTNYWHGFVLIKVQHQIANLKT